MEKMSNADMNRIFKRYAQLKMKRDEAEAEMNEIKAMLQNYMTEFGEEELIGKEHKCSYKPEVRNTFDSKAFKAAGYGELYEAFKKPNTSRKFLFN